MKLFKDVTLLILFAILIGGFIVRLYGFDNPIADWHSWRQAETSSVSRNFAQDGIDLLHPKMDNISNVQSGLDNPQGYFFVEFPIYNGLQAGLFMLFGIFTIEQWGRLVTMMSSVAAGLFLYLIVKKHTNSTTGLFAVFFYMFLPFNIYYGRTILPDTSMTMAFLGAIYFFDKWVDEKAKVKDQKSKIQFKSQHALNLVLATGFTMLALLLKPQSVFFLLPIIYLAFRTFGWRTLIQWQLYLYAIIAVAPLVAWRMWMAQYPEGIPYNAWLFNQNGIRFRPAWFRWLFYERLTVLIGGYVGIILAVIGLVQLRKVKERLFFVSFFISPLLFVSIVASGNVQHDYYQIPTIPSVAILMAIGSYFLFRWTFKSFPVGKILLILIIAGSFYFSWNIVKEYFNINNRSMIAAGAAVQRLTPKDALIVTAFNGDSAILYQFDRKGWPHMQESLPGLIKKGADYLVIVDPSEGDKETNSQYKLIEFTKQYAIFEL